MKEEPKLEDMTLRDLMAMFALMRWDVDKQKLAKDAYAAADAMIEERAKRKETK